MNDELDQFRRVWETVGKKYEQGYIVYERACKLPYMRRFAKQSRAGALSSSRIGTVRFLTWSSFNAATLQIFSN